jgi:hypothetical protein
MLLNMLAKTAAQQKSHLELRLRQHLTPEDPWQDDDHIETKGILSEVITYSDGLPYDMSVPMGRYFTDIAVEPYIKHHDNKDGFSVNVKLRHLLDDTLEINSTRVRLSTVSDGPSREIWLENGDSIVLKSGLNSISVSTNVSMKMRL